MSENTAGTSYEPIQAIDHFKEVCDVDSTIARNFLEDSGWDLETAIHQFFHSNDPEAIENQDNQQSEVMQELRQRQHAQTSSNPSPSTQIQVQPDNSLFQWVRSLFVTPLQFCYSSITKVFLFLFVLFFNPNAPIIRPRRDRAIEIGTRNNGQSTFERNRLNSQIMREQEEEYARSLAADKAKKDQRAREEQKRRDEEERAKKEAAEVEQKRLNFLAKREEICSKLPAEPVTTDETVNIKVKFPGGSVYSRRFPANSSLLALFEAVFAHADAPQDFSLLTGFPAIQLNCAPEWYREFGEVIDPANIPSFSEAGFQKSDVVLVRDNNA